LLQLSQDLRCLCLNRSGNAAHRLGWTTSRRAKPTGSHQSMQDRQDACFQARSAPSARRPAYARLR
jgi:hypothetical protein